MGQRLHNQHDWSDSDPFADCHDEDDLALAGLPDSWRHYRWWIAGVGFSALWMLESWTSTESLHGMTGFIHLSLSFVSLLLSLGFSWALYQLCKPHSRVVGQIACVLGAAVLLFEYAR